MPFISRLKKLGTLPVPELQTILTVYLINLEHSRETNLVYTSSNPIPADASPPAHIRFDCADGRTKRGDVLIWASRVRKKACFVHGCWVFDGHAWNKPSSDSEVMMDHPEHPDYQLVILSGPYVKWELKPDPDREPSLTIPDPPPVRHGARGSMNTIFTGERDTKPSEHKAGEHSHPQDHTTVSGTPDGSAMLCSSSRFSSPLSEPPNQDRPDVARPDRITPLTETPLSHHPLSPPPSQAHKTGHARSGEPRVPLTVPESFHSRPGSSSSDPLQKYRRRERPRGARSLPLASVREATPVTGAPPTPDSSKLTRSRVARNPVNPANEVLESRPVKRQRSGDNLLTGTPALDSTSLFQTVSLPPAKKRRLDEQPRPLSHNIKFFLKVPAAFAEGSRAGEGNARENDSSDDSDSSDSACAPGRMEDFWDRLNELQKEKDLLTVRVKETADLAAAHSKLARDVKNQDVLIEELQRELANATQQAEEEAQKTQRWKEEMDALRRREAGQSEGAARHIRQLDEDNARLEASLANAAKDTETQLIQLRSERDRHYQALDEVTAQLAESQALRDCAVEETKRVRQIASEMASTRTKDAMLRDNTLGKVRQLEDENRQLNTALSRSQSDFEVLVADLRTANAKATQEMQVQVEARTRQASNNDVMKEQLDEEKRRVAKLEVSLRAAQEALQRQRAHAQETETLQRRTISQLAREFQEKDQVAKDLVEKTETMIRRVEELQKSLLAESDALNEEMNKVRRTEVEIERIKKATQSDRLEITRLTTARATDQKDIAAASEEVLRLRALADELRQERTASDAALAKEIQSHADSDARALELQQLTTFLDQVHKKAEQSLLQECAAKRQVELELEVQGVRFNEHLFLADKERGRLEELLLERRSSLQLDLKSKARDLESAQAECMKLKSERDRAHAELHTCREGLSMAAESAAEEREKLLNQANAAAQALEIIRFDNAMAKSAFSAERERLHQKLADLRTQLEKELSVCREKLAESVQDRDRINEERAILQRDSTTQARDLEATRIKCSEVEAVLSTERGRFSSQLSSITERFKGELAVSREQLATAHKEHKTMEQGFQVQRVSLELKACRTAEALKSTQAEAKESSMLLRTQREQLAAELSSTREQLATLTERLATFDKERARTEDAHAKERIAFEDTSKFTGQELEEARARCTKLTAELEQERLQVQGTLSSHAKLDQELSSCRLLLAATEEKGQHLKDEQTRLQLQSASMSSNLQASQAECSHLNTELASERERFRAERSMSPEALRVKVSSLEACLDHERNTSQTLRTELAKEQSSNYWADLGSQLLRSLHEVQDQLKDEQVTRQALQHELALSRSKHRGLESCEASTTMAHTTGHGT